MQFVLRDWSEDSRFALLFPKHKREEWTEELSPKDIRRLQGQNILSEPYWIVDVETVEELVAVSDTARSESGHMLTIVEIDNRTGLHVLHFREDYED